MADVAALTGDEDYIHAIDRIWDNIVGKKLYITGGIGATSSGEAFGNNYELPNMSAYCETCAAIGNVYMNYRLFLLHGESKYYGFNVKPYTKIGATWADWVQKAERIEWINDMTGGNVLTEADIAFAVDVDGDGVADRAFNDDGTVANKAAAEVFFHTNRALLIKDLRMYVGMYER